MLGNGIVFALRPLHRIGVYILESAFLVTPCGDAYLTKNIPVILFVGTGVSQ